MPRYVCHDAPEHCCFEARIENDEGFLVAEVENFGTAMLITALLNRNYKRKQDDQENL